MDVLLTGSYGRCGTAIVDHLHDDPGYEFTYLDRTNPLEEGNEDDGDDGGQYHGQLDADEVTSETIVADVADAGAVHDAAAGQDAVIHLAGYPDVESTWDDVHQPNVIGTVNALEAAREAELETVVFGRRTT